jgi:hypothetical protein
MSEDQKVWIDEAAEMSPEAIDAVKSLPADGVTITEGKLTPDQVSAAKIAKLVADLDRLCGISNVKVNEALGALATLAAIKLSQQENRVLEVQFKKYLEQECKHQRKLQVHLTAQAAAERKANGNVE